MNRQHDSDRILDHTRQQLSALIDGELAPDEAAFLMRRLEHDEDLAGCFERWQLVGAVLRGQGGVRMPEGFSARVMARVKDEAVPMRAARPRRWVQWGGGAIAASVALVALLLVRPAGSPQRPVQAPFREVAQAAAPATPVARQAAPTVPVPGPSTPDNAAQLATAAVAVAEVPRRLASARRSGGGQALRAASRVRDRNEATQRVAAVGAAPPPSSSPTAAPFSPDHALPSRPWPRALVPGFPAGAFNVDYGGRAAAPQGMYPFEPARLAPQHVEPLPEAP